MHGGLSWKWWFMRINRSSGGDSGNEWWNVIRGVHELTWEDTTYDSPNGFEILRNIRCEMYESMSSAVSFKFEWCAAKLPNQDCAAKLQKGTVADIR